MAPWTKISKANSYSVKNLVEKCFLGFLLSELIIILSNILQMCQQAKKCNNFK